MDSYTYNGHQWVGCHQCIKGGNGSNECEPGRNITDSYLQRGCWAGEFLPELKYPGVPIVEVK